MLNKILFKSLFTAALLVGIASCGGNSGPQKGDANWVDYTKDGSVTLNLDYKDRDFYVDGIGQVTLKTAIDGDTAHFNPLKDTTESGLIKSRFFGIDTPESTGKVQEYGKPASNYTKKMLEEASANGTIVVSSPSDQYGVPQPDSTGSRYVSLIWINLTVKNASASQLYLLNLDIVQEGLSWVKNVQDMPQYSDTFYAAESQAEKYKLNLHSGVPDPTFNYGEYVDTSLLEIRDEVALNLADPDHVNKFDNARVRIQGTVCGYSNHILYLQDYVLKDKDNPSLGGEYCGINIFVGMSSIAAKYTKLNTFIQVCGLAQYTDNYGFQITDTQGRFPVGSPKNEKDAKIIYTAEQNVDTEHNLYTFAKTTEELSAIASSKNPYNLSCLNCSVEITDTLVCTSAFINSSADKEITLSFEGASFNCYIPFNYKGGTAEDPEDTRYRWVLESDFVGKTFTLKGVYVFHKTTTGKIKFQIVPNNSKDLVWIHLS